MNNQQVLDLFVDQNVLQKTQADDVLTEAQQNGKTIVQAMVDGGFMDESGFYHTVAEGIGAEFIDLNDREIGPEVVKIVPAGLARLHRALPVELVDGTLRVALADPLEPRTAEDLRFALGRDIEVVVAPVEQIEDRIRIFYGSDTSSMEEVLKQLGEVGELAYYYQAVGYNDSHGVTFFQNQNAYGADLLTNYSSSSYNSLQLEARRRLKSGLSMEANYTFSKVLSDADGDSQSRLQHFLDLANPRLERSRANFDLTHMIKADGYYNLPFGKGHRLTGGKLSRVVGGWTIGSTMVWQSGAPFSITSGRGTYNRSSRSYYNDANTSLTGSQLAGVVKFRMTGDGPMVISQAAINPDDGSGVNIDGDPSFKGQAFFNPAAGTIGALQRRMFDGPWIRQWPHVRPAH
jgi:hypothetical protein